MSREKAAKYSTCTARVRLLRCTVQCCTEEAAENAAVRDGERAAVHVLDGQLVEARLLAETRDLSLDLREAHAVDAAHDGHHEALRRRHCHRHVHVVAVHDLLRRVVDHRVHHRLVVQRVRRRAHERAHEAELEAVLLGESVAVHLAHFGQIAIRTRKNAHSNSLRTPPSTYQKYSSMTSVHCSLQYCSNQILIRIHR